MRRSRARRTSSSRPTSTRGASRRSGTRPSRRCTSSTSGACTPRTRSTSTTCSCSRSQVLERFPEALERWQKAFRYVLVDEYQDTNHAQYRLLQLLAAKHGNLCVVGDPDQSIYAFRGADIRNILEFERDFPGTQVVALEQNYRSTNTILRAANALIEHNTRAQAEAPVLRPRRGRPRARRSRSRTSTPKRGSSRPRSRRLIDGGLSASEIAVFYRTNAQSRVLEDVLVRQDVPYQVIGGPRFYERAEIRDATAYLTVLVNPQDATSLLRIANRPRRGIGDTSIQRLVTHAENTGPHALRGAWPIPRRPASRLPPAARSAASTRRWSRSWRSRRSCGSTSCSSACSRRPGTLDALEAERTIEARGRIENLQELVGVAREYRQQTADASLAGFLQDISLVSDQDTIRDDRGLVTLMTLHNAKGLEFRAVFVIGMEEGIFPHSRVDRGAGRGGGAALCYVGMTRAMERLTLTHTMSRTLFGRREYNLASRFLDELPSEVERERLRPSSWSGYGSPTSAATRAASRASLSRRATPSGTARSARASSPRSSPAASSRSASPTTERSGG